MTALTQEITSKMLTWDTAMEALSASEPLTSRYFTAKEDQTEKVVLHLEPGFNAGLKDRPGTDIIAATIQFGDEQYKMTKDALLDLTSTFGIQRDYMCKMPAALMEVHLNYWLTNVGKDYRLLTDKADTALALTKSASIVPFSNVAIMESIAKELQVKGMSTDEVFVDYKIHHDLRRTAIRLIMPGAQTLIQSARDSASEPDTWSTGIQFVNSLTGTYPLAITGYLFSWFCTNGAISTHAESAQYNRRQQGQQELEVREWVEGSTKNVLGAMDHELDAVAKLVQVDLEAELNSTLMDIFTTQKVPTSQRESIIGLLLDSGDTTAYGIMQSITAAANGVDVVDIERERLMRIGGDMTAAFGSRCTACHRLAL